MNRTLRLRRVPVTRGWADRVHVATVFDDAERGMVRSAAAPLLATALAAAPGCPQVSLGPAPPVCPPSGVQVAAGEMLAVSYLDRSGSPAGFALVAERADAASIAIAGQAALRWLGLLRSRRLLVADAEPLCWGAQRALRLIESAASTGPLFVVGHPVAAQAVTAELERSGVVFGASLDAVPDGGQVVLPAHGAGLAVRAEAAARGLRLLDATCPLVAAVHADSASYAERGDTVLVIGRAGHAALPGVMAQAGEAAVLVQSPAEAEALDNGLDGLDGLDPERISFVIEPGMRVEDAMAVLGVLRRRFPKLHGHHFDVLCDAASDRWQAVASVAAASELTLIITGAGHDADTAALLSICRETAAAVLPVTRLADLDLDQLAGVTCVGLLRALSAPAGLEDQVIRVLSGLGPLTVLHRGTRTRPPAPPAPPEDQATMPVRPVLAG